MLDLPFGRDRKYLSNVNPFVNALLGGWQIAGINTVIPGEQVTLTYTPIAAQQVSGIQQDFRGANNYRPNVSGEVLVGTGDITNWLSRINVTVPTDPSQPFGNAPRNSVRAPLIWTVDLVAFGTITSTYDPRVIQLGLKVNF